MMFFKMINVVSFTVKPVSLKINQIFSKVDIVAVITVKVYFKISITAKELIDQILRYPSNGGCNTVGGEVVQESESSFLKVSPAQRRHKIGFTLLGLC
jgi:hypothetical protein